MTTRSVGPNEERLGHLVEDTSDIARRLKEIRERREVGFPTSGAFRAGQRVTPDGVATALDAIKAGAAKVQAGEE